LGVERLGFRPARVIVPGQVPAVTLAVEAAHVVQRAQQIALAGWVVGALQAPGDLAVCGEHGIEQAAILLREPVIVPVQVLAEVGRATKAAGHLARPRRRPQGWDPAAPRPGAGPGRGAAPRGGRAWGASPTATAATRAVSGTAPPSWRARSGRSLCRPTGGPDT